MAIHYYTTLANTRMTAVVTAIGGTGYLVVGTSALAGGATGTLVSFALSATAGTVAARVLTFSGVPITAVAAASGLANKAEIRTAALGTVIADQLTVGLTGSGADVIIDTTTIVLGRTIYFISGAFTHP